jgi:hypothetical protein
MRVVEISITGIINILPSDCRLLRTGVKNNKTVAWVLKDIEPNTEVACCIYRLYNGQSVDPGLIYRDTHILKRPQDDMEYEYHIFTNI